MKWALRTIMSACLAAATLSIAGCVGTKVHIAPVPVEKLDLDRGRQISGTASGFQLLLFIPIDINSRQARAYERLVNEAGSDYIADVKIEESWTYALVGTVYHTTFTATAYPVKSGAPAAAAPASP